MTTTSSQSTLAIAGGQPAITHPLPHDPWPPRAEPDELDELGAQRDLDISIKGSSGPILELEQAFLDFLERRRRHAVTFNSGTSALLAAYFALGANSESEIIGPALTFHAALSPALLLGSTIRFADIDRRTRCVDPASVEAAITEKTRILVAVHQWGHPCDMDALLDIAGRHGLKVLEDCSHAHGSRYRGRPVGTFGDAAAFSLQANKAIFAGEGGLLVTDDDSVHDHAVLLGHYRDRSRDEVTDPRLQAFWVTGFGQKYRMSPFNAIVAKHSLQRFGSRMAQRHECLRYFTERLAEIDYIDCPSPSTDVDMGAWYGFKPLFVPSRLPELDRAGLIAVLRAEGLDISAPSAPVLSGLPLYRDPLRPAVLGPPSPTTPADTPVANEVEQLALSLPTFSRWPEDRIVIDEYIAAMKKVAANRGELC